MKRCAIIGGGISGLTAAYYLQKKSNEIGIDLYEQQDRLGGVLRTEHLEGCILEAGPDSFLTQKKAALVLCGELGLQSSLIGSNDSIRKTFLFSEGALRALPDGFFFMVPTRLLPFLTTDLLSWPGKFNAVADLFSLPEDRDTTVAQFVEKRFGKEILQQIAEPLVSGIYGADVNRLSLRSALPQIWELQKKGSLVLHSAGRSVRTAHESLFTTLAGGMETLVQKLQERCSSVRWKLASPVSKIEKDGGLWRIGEESYEFLLTACSTLPEIDSVYAYEIRSLLGLIRRNSAIVIMLGYENLEREGFGWLVPSSERRSVLACTYVSNKFPQRAPEKQFLIRLFIGGAQANQWIDKSDTEIYQEVLAELKRIAGIDRTPIFYRIHRWRKAMPEYPVGHAELITTVNRLAKLETNLFLTGNLFAGVGIPDCITHAERVADEICHTGVS